MTDAVKATNEDKPSSPWVHPSERVLDPSKIDKSLLDRMPDPTGWRILVLPYKGKGKTEEAFCSDQILANQEISTQVGYVLKVGPLAYEDKDKFPLGTWCNKGDWVIFARYAGSRFKIEGGEVRILNDDEILAKISDPEDILHV